MAHPTKNIKTIKEAQGIQANQEAAQATVAAVAAVAAVAIEAIEKIKAAQAVAPQATQEVAQKAIREIKADWVALAKSSKALNRIRNKAIELFEGDEDAADYWMSQPARGLGGRKPLDLVSTASGASEVEDLINRLEHGVFV